MALYSQIEDRYLAALTAVQFPEAPVADTQQSVTNATSVDGMQLAAGPSQTVTDAGAGRGSYAGFDPRQDAANKAPMGEVKPYDPTVREQLAEFLQAGFERFGMDRYKARKNAQSLIGGPNSNLPLDMGLADIVPFLGTALQTQEAVRMGGDAVTSAQQGNYGTAALQAGGAALGLVPGAAGTVKAGKGVAKSLPKNIPVGLSTEAVGGIEKALTPQQAFKSVNVGDKVDGRTVLDGVPNMSSIGASLDEYTVVEGIKEIPLSAFDNEYVSSIKAEKLDKRTRELADAIKKSKQITPLIVVADSKGFYVLEGGHRFDALIASKAKSLPAVVVIDESDKPSEAVLKGLK